MRNEGVGGKEMEKSTHELFILCKTATKVILNTKKKKKKTDDQSCHNIKLGQILSHCQKQQIKKTYTMNHFCKQNIFLRSQLQILQVKCHSHSCICYLKTAKFILYCLITIFFHYAISEVHLIMSLPPLVQVWALKLLQIIF